MKIAVLHVFVAMATGWSATVGTGQTCERISNKMCQGLGYNYAMFPNSVNHKSQNEAALEVYKYYILIQAGCSKYLRIFACSIYMPACSRIPIPPCGLLCEQAKKECEPLMKTFGFPWPKEFDCGIYAGLGSQLCISAPGSLSALPHPLSVCEEISVPMCKGIGYNYTKLPNTMNHTTQSEVGLEVHQFFPLVQAECSSYFNQFLCSVYTPQCTRMGLTIPPCRSLCEESRRGCEPLMKNYGFAWPANLNCSKFPVKGSGAICHLFDLQSATPHASVCEEISVPMCKGIGYNYTKLPNMLNQTTQNNAALEVQQFFPLVQVKCSSYFNQFLCSVYTPQCTQSGATIPPCRSLCEESRRGCEPLMKKYGFAWPTFLNCSNFPVKGTGVICNSFDLQSDIKPTTKAPLTEFRKILTTVQGVLTSPNYPNTYPLGIRYEWTIQLPDSYNLIKITIEKMRLEEDKNCFYDYVMIKDKMLNQVGPRHCGTYRSPYEISVRGNKAIIIFVSDATTSKAGFSIKYRGLQADS